MEAEARQELRRQFQTRVGGLIAKSMAVSARLRNRSQRVEPITTPMCLLRPRWVGRLCAAARVSDAIARVPRPRLTHVQTLDASAHELPPPGAPGDRQGAQAWRLQLPGDAAAGAAGTLRRLLSEFSDELQVCLWGGEAALCQSLSRVPSQPRTPVHTAPFAIPT